TGKLRGGIKTPCEDQIMVDLARYRVRTLVEYGSGTGGFLRGRQGQGLGVVHEVGMVVLGIPAHDQRSPGPVEPEVPAPFERTAAVPDTLDKRRARQRLVAIVHQPGGERTASDGAETAQLPVVADAEIERFDQGRG